MNDDVDQALLRIAAAAVDDPGRASEQLTAWFGTSPNPTGERRLREAPQAIPRVLADTMRRGGLDDRSGAFWAPDFTEPGIPEEVQVIIRATARHLNGDPAVGDDLVRAHLAVHGLPGGWNLTVAGLELLRAEIAEQREDGHPAPPVSGARHDQQKHSSIMPGRDEGPRRGGAPR
ncbi:hypothetical protein DMP23_47490 [Amycolatopsis sp. A1MSW2902]|uniref:hypothetical protein n=1 Tax=Amycolatopsis sp. A1MSW2902 TaxID=687413 RepID=UPI00307E27B2